MDILIQTCLHNYVQFYFDTASYRLREKDSLTLKKNHAPTNLFKFSSFNHIVDMWNSLPFHIRSASGISSFKRRMTNFLTNTNCISLHNIFQSIFFYLCIFIMYNIQIFFSEIFCYFELLNSQVVCLSMGSLTLLQPILLPFFFWLLLHFCKLPLNCDK